MIIRDMQEQLLLESPSMIQAVVGPRQCGKSTLLAHISDPNTVEISFDDWQMRQLAEKDPALFLEQFKPPLLLDEIQYVPNLFPELKRLVDIKKRQRLKDRSTSRDVLFRLTGSNQILMDANIKESLAGRAGYYYLNTLSVHEILTYDPSISISHILFNGGWPELYIEKNTMTTHYLNDYIRSYIEKDIILTAGIQKQNEFLTVLGLLAARTATFAEYAAIGKYCGVKPTTIKEWVSILQQNDIVYRLLPYSNNLNKRLTKTAKLYFLDTGLAVRLQGWSEETPLLNSPQAGALFETLVLSEIIKFIRNYRKNWRVYTWRTKDKEEIDFILELEPGKVILLDAKMAMQSAQPMSIPNSVRKTFPNCNMIYLVTYGGNTLKLSNECTALPITRLHDWLATL